MKHAIYALLDCNNFYASCERVFNPSLKNKPIVILSNNDGCVIARSNESKAIGIPMGAPYFKYKKLIEKSRTMVFSSNYALYGDMSDRIMNLLPAFTPEFEIYSIDEAFLKFDSLAIQDFVAYSHDIKQHVFQCTGIPVSIGIGPTKTLAKVANYVAKKKTLNGVFEINVNNIDEMLANLSVDDIWGIGRRLGERLRQRGIHSALDLKCTSPVIMRKQFSVIMEKMVHELNGHSCLGLEDVEPKKSITSSRSFCKKVTSLSELKEAIASHCMNACTKLRAQASYAHGIMLFIKTSKHDGKQPYYSNSKIVMFNSPLNDTGLIITQALEQVESLFQAGLKYNKAGVILLDLVENINLQLDMLTPSPNRENLMRTLDKINEKYKRNTLFYASAGMHQHWQAKRDKKSPNFTTSWQELCIAYAN